MVFLLSGLGNTQFAIEIGLKYRTLKSSFVTLRFVTTRKAWVSGVEFSNSSECAFLWLQNWNFDWKKIKIQNCNKYVNVNDDAIFRDCRLPSSTNSWTAPVCRSVFTQWLFRANMTTKLVSSSCEKSWWKRWWKPLFRNNTSTNTQFITWIPLADS